MEVTNNWMEGIFFYETTIRDLILKAKFLNDEAAAVLLMDLVETFFLNNEQCKKNIIKFSPVAVAYIPTHWSRRKWRGFDLPHMFALKIAKELGVSVSHILKISGIRPRQSSLKKGMRSQAIKGAFKVCSTKTHFERLLLVDDIITTGATFSEASIILKQSVENIRCLAIAKTP